MNDLLESCFPGVWKLTFGTPDVLTPHKLLGGKESPALETLSEVPFPFSEQDVKGEQRKNGYLVTLPITSEERLYGLGLQFGSYLQNGRRKTLRANADAPKDTGDSHAPVPFYLSTCGYGVLADTAKWVTFDCGATQRIAGHTAGGREVGAAPGGNTQELYEEKARGQQVSIFVPGAKGLSLYVFADQTMRGALERYNLFSGGGVMPPIWGLGALYRCYTHSDQQQVEALIRQFAQDDIPLSMLGLEPGWHSQAYSCSFRWSEQRYPCPERLIALAKEQGLALNLWEQSYVHPTADCYEAICPYSGDYEVWGGAVPDFATPQARQIYSEMQGRLIDQGISAFKLDECDGSDYTGSWYFPEFSAFPSGLTGEEEKNLLGALVQRSIQDAFSARNLRTFSQVRAGWSYGAPMGFVLYSDLYDHREFIRGVANASFSGLLWSPEVRQCSSGKELIRRMQSAALSPMMVINAWMIPSPPWKQFDIDKNLAGDLLPDGELERQCRELIRLRNQLIPYLYTAYGKYAKEGTPPFRALALDYPQEPGLAQVDDCYLMGEDILVAPILNEGEEREVLLPPGVWYDFWTEKRLEGNQTILARTPQIPLYVRQGAAIALGDGNRIGEQDVIPLEVRLYGSDTGRVTLIEDDRVSLNYQKGEQRLVELSFQNGKLTSQGNLHGYQVDQVRVIQ